VWQGYGLKFHSSAGFGEGWVRKTSGVFVSLILCAAEVGLELGDSVDDEAIRYYSSCSYAHVEAGHGCRELER
jgi:hypothetical protein